MACAASPSRIRSPPTRPPRSAQACRSPTIYNAVDLDRFHPAPLDAHGSTPPPDSPRCRKTTSASDSWRPWPAGRVTKCSSTPYHACRPTCRRGFTWSEARFINRPVRSTTCRSCKPEATSLGLADRLGFTGHQPDPALALRSLDVVVHASTRPEPFGRVIVEAMACGKAVVAAPTGGAAELFEDGVSALASPSGDAAALASTLQRLIADAGLRARLGKAARAAAVSRFDRGRLAEEWSTVYADALAGTMAHERRGRAMKEAAV